MKCDYLDFPKMREMTSVSFIFINSNAFWILLTSLLPIVMLSFLPRTSIRSPFSFPLKSLIHCNNCR